MKTLRPLLVGLALLTAAAPALADGANHQIGFLGGFNIATLNIEATAGLQSRSAFAIGGIYQRDLNEKWGVRIEPAFVDRGAKVTQRDAYLGSVDRLELKLSYLEIPVLLKLDLGEDRVRGYLLAGGAVAFLTSSEAELSISGTSQTADFKDIFRDIDAGLQFGLGASFPAATNRVFVDGRFSLGLVNISKSGTVQADGQDIVVDPRPVKTRDFRILVGLLFPWPGGS